jgi:hypothetical protein
VSLFEDVLYVSDGDTVTRTNIDGSGASPLFPPDSFNFISLVGADATTVFFDNDMVLSSLPATGGEPVELGRGGGDSLFSGTSRFAQFLPGRNVVYWVDDSSSYGWTALDGTSCGILGE